MAAATSAFWMDTDARMPAAGPCLPATGASPAEAYPIALRIESALGPRAEALLPAPASRPASEPGLAPIADWTPLIETSRDAGLSAQDQDLRLRQQSAANDALADALAAVRQDAEMYKALAAETRTRAEELLREMQRAAEARIAAIQARADALIQEAMERARLADRRAETAEGWLRQIEQASFELLPAALTAAA
jgi:hypothetical protein